MSDSRKKHRAAQTVLDAAKKIANDGGPTTAAWLSFEKTMFGPTPELAAVPSLRLDLFLAFVAGAEQMFTTITVVKDKPKNPTLEQSLLGVMDIATRLDKLRDELKAVKIALLKANKVSTLQ